MRPAWEPHEQGFGFGLLWQHSWVLQFSFLWGRESYTCRFCSFYYQERTHRRWRKDCGQQGLAAGGCSGSTNVLWAWYQLGYCSCSCCSNLWSSARDLSQRTELRGAWEILCKYSFVCSAAALRKGGGGMQHPVSLDYRQQQHLHPHCPIASASRESCFGKLFVVAGIARAWF